MTLDQKRDSIFCGLALLTALAIGGVSFGYDFQSSYFPRLLSIFLGALAIGLWVRVRRSDAPDEAETDPGEVRAQILGFGKIVAAVLIYIAAMQFTNYTVATVLFLLAMMLLLGERNVLRLAMVTVLVTGVLYYLFFIFLGVTPPEGLMAFS